MIRGWLNWILTSVLRRRERPRLQALPQLDPQALLPTGRRPVPVPADLQTGFKQVQVFAAGGGGTRHSGWRTRSWRAPASSTATPSYSFTWTGKPQALRLFFEAQRG